MLHAVLELADVARPVVGHQLLGARRGELEARLAVARGELLEEVLREMEHVAAALAERGHVDLHDVDAVVEVLAKALLVDLVLEVAVRRGDDARVERDLLVRANGADLALLERAQQLRLHVDRELADLVEEERAARRLDEETGALRLRVGEGAARVAEELALEERMRDGRAVDRDEGAALAAATVVNAARDELLAGARLAVDEDRRIALADAADELVDPAHCARLADDLLRRRLAVDRLAKALHLVREATVLDGARHREEEELRVDRLRDEVVGADADRADGRLEAALPRDHDDRHVRPRAEHALAQVEAAHLRHLEIREHHVEVLLGDEVERALRVGRRRDLEAMLPERHLEQVAGLLLVVDDKDVALHREYLMFLLVPAPCPAVAARARERRNAPPEH